MSEHSARTKMRIGQNQLQRASERPPEAPAFRRLSNSDTLTLAKAGLRNKLEGLRELNRLKKQQHTDEKN